MWNRDKKQTSTVGLNEYADLSTEEFGALKGCLTIKHSRFGVEESEEEAETEEEAEKEEEEEEEEEDGPPASWNWNSNGAVTPIKN